jgi:protein-S-isoprenylcysteine O-methyltransferase Ste14
LIYVLQSLFFTFIYISLIFLFPDRLLYVISSPWRYFTLLIQAGAIIGVYLSLRQTGILAFLGLDFLLARPGFVPPDHLSTGGIYRYARHPLYTFSLIFIWLLPIMTWNILAWNIGVTAYVFIGSYFEEKKLIQDFGQEYLDYRNQVPAFLPVPVRKP